MSIIKAYKSIYFFCFTTSNENELQFEIASQQGKGVTSPVIQSSPKPFWVSQQLQFINEYDYCVFTFYNGTTQLFSQANVGKFVNNIDASQQCYININGTLTI